MATYLVEQLTYQAEKYRHRELYRAKKKGEGEWISVSWTDFFTKVSLAARAFYALGCKEGERVLICSLNCPEFLITEYACYFNRMADAPVFAFSSTAQLEYIAKSCTPRIICVGGPGQYDLARSFCERNPGAVNRIVLFYDDKVEAPADCEVITWSDFLALGKDMTLASPVLKRLRNGTEDDIASLIYTSGTTGNPKGVILTHKQFAASIQMHIKMLEDVEEGMISLSFLPMSHVFEKSWLHFCLAKGLRIAFNYNPRNIVETLQEIRPNVMCCVPRFWEKIYTGIMERLERMNIIERKLAKYAIRIGRRVNLRYMRNGRHVPEHLMRQYNFWDKRLFSKVRKKVGISSPCIFPTAGAALSPKIIHFMRSIGIRVVYGYGMTETTATVTCYPKVNYEIGSVGVPIPSIRLKIDNSGEILLKGPTLFSGYYNNDEANAEVFTADGWFKTGDSGYIGPNNELVLTSRKKDMIKTTNGKLIAPQATESILASNRFIDEVALVGEGKKFVSALVVPNFGYLEMWAKKEGIQYSSRKELCENPAVKEHMMSEMHLAQQDMPEYEKVKNITLLTEHFSLEKGEVTNTQKIRRAVISDNYADHIAAMYPDERLDEEF